MAGPWPARRRPLLAIRLTLVRKPRLAWLSDRRCGNAQKSTTRGPECGDAQQVCEPGRPRLSPARAAGPTDQAGRGEPVGRRCRCRGVPTPLRRPPATQASSLASNCSASWSASEVRVAAG